MAGLSSTRRIGTQRGWLAAAAFVGALLGATTAEAQIVPQAPPVFGSAQLNPSRPAFLQGVAGGNVSLSSVGGSCRGYTQPAPSHVLVVPPGASQLRVAVQGNGFDTTLMVQLPDGRVICDDDGGGSLNPLVETPSVAGQVRVWVGSYSGSNGAYRLDATVVGGGYGPPSGPPPSMGGMPMFGTAEVTMGGRPDPVLLNGRFGGPLQASTISGDCRGWISQAPNHVVNARTGFPNLRFVVRGDADSTLVVRYPDGRVVCDDDGGGSLQPLVEGPTGPGQILVWVGSYASGSVGNYQLGVTTNPSITASNLGSSVVVAPTGPTGPTIVTPPPQTGPVVTARVPLQPRIPVTLIGPGMSPGTVAVWSPMGGPSVEVGLIPSGGGYRVYATVNGTQVSVVDVPASIASDAVVTITQRPDQRLLIRADQISASQMMLMLVQMVNGTPALAEQWTGSFNDRTPRWAR